MRTKKEQKAYGIGLALSGGGAKGFAHLGAFRLLEECGIVPDIIAGTSAGALAGVLFADGYSSEEIIDIFTGREFSEFARPQLPKVGLFEMSRMRTFLQKHLRAKRFEDLQIPLVVVATNLDKGESHEFRSGLLIDTIVASCSIPIIFCPVLIDGNYYVDGGLFQNFPVSAIRHDCLRVIGVNVSPLIPQKYKQTIWGVAERSYHYMFRANTLEERLLCDILVETDQVGSYKTFDLNNVRLLADIGYRAAVDAFHDFIQEQQMDTLVAAIMSKQKSLKQKEN